jgi:BASS family bile acid:Na+ symporter
MSAPEQPALDLAAQGLESSVLSDVVLPAALAVITLGMGLGLTRADFLRIGEEPRGVAVGLAGQLVLLPAVALGVAYVAHTWYALPASLAVGLLLLACCPGGATSNLVTYLARADAALSVTLTSVTSLASVLTTPLLFAALTSLVLGAASEVRVGLVDTALLVLVVVALPILAGMAVRERWPEAAARAEPKFRVASIAFLALVVGGLVLENRAELARIAGTTLPLVLVLNGAALGGGLLLGRLGRLRERQSRAVAIEVGFQNGTLGIAIALTQLGDSEAALVPGFYSLVMFATGGLLAHAWSRSGQADEAPLSA